MTDVGSEFLHKIEETEGRTPTREEQDEAVRRRRAAAGLPEFPEKITKYNRPYQSMVGPGSMSEEGQRMVEETSLASEEVLAQDAEALAGAAEELGTAPIVPVAPDESTAPLFPPRPAYVSASFAHGAAQRDALITGNTNDQAAKVDEYRKGVDTVQDEMIAVLESSYNEAFVDQGILKDIQDRPADEQIARITSEYMRLDANKQHVRNLIGLNMLRQGLGKLPVEALDRMWIDTTPGQAQALYDQYKGIQLAELNTWVDSMAASQAATTAQFTGEIIRQDVAPFYGAITRVMGTRHFIPDDVDINWIRQGLPGEIRQEIRNWWVDASHEERLDYVQGMQKELEKLQKGNMSGLYTRYLMIENLMGIFTEDLMQSDDPTDSLDRLMGNLDTTIGAIFGIGLFYRRGKSIFQMWGTKKENLPKQLANAGGSRAASAELDDSIYEAAEEWGYTIDELSVDELVKPKQLELEFGPPKVDTNPQRITPQQARAERVMDTTEEADVTLLSDADKANALHKTAQKLAESQHMTPLPKMSSVDVNETSITFDNIYASPDGEGWTDITALLDDMKAADPYQEFQVYRRGSHGELEKLDMSWEDIIKYYSEGRIPFALDKLIERDPEWTELARFFGGRKVSSLSNEELQSALNTGWIPADSIAHLKAQKILNDRADLFANPELKVDIDDPMSLINGEELFVRFETTHFYDADDIVDLDGAFKYYNPAGQHMFNFTNRLLAPNTKFDSIYKGFLRSYLMEESALLELNAMVRPFNNLSTKGKLEVNEMMEWAERYAKDMFDTNGIAKAPTTFELRAQFPHVSDAAFDGYMAALDTQHTMHRVLNRRLHRDFNNKGYKTMRAHDRKLPNYHGKASAEPEPGIYYDPVKKQMVEVSEEEMADIVQRGGGAIELEFPIDAPTGGKFNRVIARPGHYQIGKLSERPLKFHEGYYYRFYEDPYMVIKVTERATVNGKKIDETVEEAVATAGSHKQAQEFIGSKYHDTGKGTFRRLDGKGGVFKIVPTRDISNTEGTLYANASLHREGRLFWDERGKRLPDTHGNRAEIADPTTAMARGLALATRQSTQEGLMKTLKKGFKAEFGDLPRYVESEQLMALDDLKGAEQILKKGRAEATGQTRHRYNNAISILRYMRSQMGVDSAAVPLLREKALMVAQWLERVTFGKGQKVHRTLQRSAMGLDPFSKARRIAYGAFMTLRPARQVLLQSAQITMLAGLAPGYIGSGKIFFDAMALRRGIRQLNKTGVDDGYSTAKVAKAMGWSKKEYNRVVEELQRSGLLGTVSTHANRAASAGLKAQLDPTKGMLHRFQYNIRAQANRGWQSLSRLGFELGERNNLTFTYLVALRRMKKKWGVSDITKLDRKQWDDIAREADSLALAMARPNKFMYQSGFTGTLFQFMSFQHRAALTLAFMNPALSKVDSAKVWLSTYLLWGTNMFGAEDLTREWLAGLGLSNNAQDEVVPGTTLQDLLAEGLIEVGLNQILNLFKEEATSDIDFGVMAPGAAIFEIYEQMYDLVVKSPWEEKWQFVGPSGQPIGGFMKGMKFLTEYWHNENKTPAEKLIRVSEQFARETLPGFNDANRSWIAYQTGVWLDKDGDTLEVQAAWENIAARGVFGMRTNEELATYRMRTLHWENQDNVNDMVKGLRTTMKAIVKDWDTGDRTDEQIYEFTQTLWSLVEDAPEGVRQEIYERVLTEMDDEGDSIIKILSESHTNATSVVSRLAVYINQQQNWSPEQRHAMSELVKNLGDGWKARDEQFNQIMEDQKRED